LFKSSPNKYPPKRPDIQNRENPRKVLIPAIKAAPVKTKVVNFSITKTLINPAIE
tara:strand:+ start:91 stop:255 length:165 start_codon:yes stop_codon:yes gene_type:complete